MELLIEFVYKGARIFLTFANIMVMAVVFGVPGPIISTDQPALRHINITLSRAHLS